MNFEYMYYYIQNICHKGINIAVKMFLTTCEEIERRCAHLSNVNTQSV